MHWAVNSDAFKCARLLLTYSKQEGKRLSLKADKFRVTPIHLAATKGSSKMLKLLIDEIAHIERNSSEDEKNQL
jgi:ankyrin repeat protein